MAGTFKFELVSPERIVLSSEDTVEVQLTGSEGDFTVLAGHAPVISTLRPGIVTVATAGGKKRYFVNGGFVEVDPAHVTVLTQAAFDTAEAAADVVAKAVSAAEAELAGAKTDDARLMAQSALDGLKSLRAA